MAESVELRVLPNGNGSWYWEVITPGPTVIARGVADTEPAACQRASEAARKARRSKSVLSKLLRKPGVWLNAVVRPNAGPTLWRLARPTSIGGVGKKERPRPAEARGLRWIPEAL
jgi:hypothetical protein